MANAAKLDVSSLQQAFADASSCQSLQAES